MVDGGDAVGVVGEVVLLGKGKAGSLDVKSNDARARAQARRPIAPQPKTQTVWPAERSARREAWRRTERVSARAATS